MDIKQFRGSWSQGFQAAVESVGKERLTRADLEALAPEHTIFVDNAVSLFEQNGATSISAEKLTRLGVDYIDQALARQPPAPAPPEPRRDQGLMMVATLLGMPHLVVDLERRPPPMRLVDVRALPVDLRVDHQLLSMQSQLTAQTQRADKLQLSMQSQLTAQTQRADKLQLKVDLANTLKHVEARLTKRSSAITDQLQTLKAEIGTLKDDVASLEGDVASKRARVDTLEQQVHELEAKLSVAQRQQQMVRIFAAWFGGASGLMLVEAVSDYKASIDRLNTQIDTARADAGATAAALATYDAAQASLRTLLEDLETQAQTIGHRLGGVDLTPSDPSVALGSETALLNALVANLSKQRDVLLSLKANAAQMSGSLDQAISGLTHHIDALKADLKATEADTYSVLLDLVIANGHLPASVDVGSLTLSTKGLLVNQDAELKRAFVRRVEAAFEGLPVPLVNEARERLLRALD